MGRYYSIPRLNRVLFKLPFIKWLIIDDGSMDYSSLLICDSLAIKYGKKIMH